MTNLVNMTPHALNLVGNGDAVTLQPSGIVLRAVSSATVTDTVNGFAVSRQVFSMDLDTLPDPQPDTVYVVSTLVLHVLKSLNLTRVDFVSPDTSPASVVRDDKGQVVGVKGFQIL